PDPTKPCHPWGTWNDLVALSSAVRDAFPKYRQPSVLNGLVEPFDPKGRALDKISPAEYALGRCRRWGTNQTAANPMLELLERIALETARQFVRAATWLANRTEEQLQQLLRRTARRVTRRILKPRSNGQDFADIAEPPGD